MMYKHYLPFVGPGVNNGMKGREVSIKCHSDLHVHVELSSQILQETSKIKFCKNKKHEAKVTLSPLLDNTRY